MSKAGQKSLALHIKSAGDPSAAQLAAIHGYTLKDLPADKLYVRTFIIAHNAIDRDKETFDEALLSDFARTLPGKGLHVKHPTGWQGDGGPAKGRWFGAELQRMGLDEARALLREPKLQWPPGVQTAVLLMADAYLVRHNGNADMLEEIDGGVVGDVSVGFTAKDYERVVDDDGHELNVYRWLGPGEALEASLVWLGAQPGARAIKQATTREPENDVDTEQKLAAANTKATDLQKQLDEATPSRDAMLALRKALGDNAHLVDKPDVLADTIKAATAYRGEMIDTIVAGERKSGMCGDDDEAVAAAKAIYAGMPLATLKARAKFYDDHVPTPKVTPANPNAAATTPGASKGVIADNPAFSA